MSYDDILGALTQLDREIAYADIPDGDWCLVGSVVLWLLGLRQEVGDIDFFITKNGYDALRKHGWEEVTPNPDHPPMLEKKLNGIKANGWYEWAHPQHVQVERVLTAQVEVGGWPAMRLETLRDWKAALRRPKDLTDIEAIDSILGPRDK